MPPTTAQSASAGLESGKRAPRSVPSAHASGVQEIQLPAASDAPLAHTYDILLVDDDPALGRALIRSLAPSGLAIECVHTAGEALVRVRGHAFDAILLDRHLGDDDGLRHHEGLRRAGLGAPILMFTFDDSDRAHEEALQAGVDDFVIKDASAQVVAARIVAAIQRRQRESLVLRAGGGRVTVDRGTQTAYLDRQPLDLTTHQFRLLNALVRRAGRVVSKLVLLEEIWQTKHDPGSNKVDQEIRRLRVKLGSASEELVTAKNEGYWFRR